MTTTPSLFPRTKKTKTPVACWCGCGGSTKSRFVPGHDARFHGLAKRVARNEADAETALASLPHNEAREAFEAYANKTSDKDAAKTDTVANVAASLLASLDN